MTRVAYVVGFTLAVACATAATPARKVESAAVAPACLDGGGPLDSTAQPRPAPACGVCGDLDLACLDACGALEKAQRWPHPGRCRTTARKFCTPGPCCWSNGVCTENALINFGSNPEVDHSSAVQPGTLLTGAMLRCSAHPAPSESAGCADADCLCERVRAHWRPRPQWSGARLSLPLPDTLSGSTVGPDGGLLLVPLGPTLELTVGAGGELRSCTLAP